jgi:hypothetical protein
MDLAIPGFSVVRVAEIADVIDVDRAMFPRARYGDLPPAT